jgi:hypothetical protein
MNQVINFINYQAFCASNIIIYLMKKILLLFIAYISFYSCVRNKKNIESNAQQYYDVQSLEDGNNINSIIDLKIDTIIIANNIPTSFVGDFWVDNKAIYFSDKYFNYVFEFDLNGELANTFLGKGDGPKEIPDLDDIIPLQNGDFAVLSSSTSSIYYFDSRWTIIERNVIDFEINRSREEVLKEPKPSISDPYELETGYDGILKNWNKNYLAIGMNASHPKFNGYFNSDFFYNFSRIIGLINKKTGKIEKLVGRRSPIFLEKKNIPNFNHFSFEIDDNYLYVSFYSDSVIYVIDKKTELAMGKFGKSGLNMRTNYLLTDTYEEALNNEISDLQNFGYYKDLKLIPEENLIFRSYTKGSNSTTDGLQVYKDFNLIADLKVPVGFKIIGKVKNYFIATVKDPEENDEETLKFFKVTFIYEE